MSTKGSAMIQENSNTLYKNVKYIVNRCYHCIPGNCVNIFKDKYDLDS